jgi:PadR family transcriptional regulator PadR
MDPQTETGKVATQLEENLKKALSELVLLHLFSVRPHYIGELSGQINRLSNHALNLVFPYAAIYRMARAGDVQEIPRRIAPDGRLRQYYQITEQGKARFEEMKVNYAAFSEGVERILSWEGDSV